VAKPEKNIKPAEITPEIKAPEAKKNNDKVWLTWDEQRIWVIHPTKSSNMLSTLTAPDAVLTREQVKAALKQTRQLNVLPGLHEYPADLWSKCVDHEDVQQALNDGRLRVNTNEDFGQKGDALAPAQTLPEALDAVQTGVARVLAENCQDIKVLEKWLEAERMGKARGTILTELEAQIMLCKETDKTLKDAAE